MFYVIVVPSFGGAFQNHCSIKFTTRFPEQYPNTPIEYVELECIEGAIPSDWLNVSRLQLLSKANDMVGEQMIYALIEQLKEYLENYNEDIQYGYFGMLSDEVIYRVFEFLSPADISSASRVNKTLNRVANDPTIWQNLCRCHIGELEYQTVCQQASIHNPKQTSADIKQKLYWRRCYNLTKNWIMKDMPYSYAAAVMDRKGTGDLWHYLIMQKHKHAWRDYFIYYLQTKYGIVLNPDGKMMRSNDVIGKWKLKSSEFVRRKYGDLDWVKAIDGLRACPYLGNLLGFIFWTVSYQESAHYVMSCMVEATRGIVTLLADSSKFIQCVTFRKYPLTTVVDPHQYGTNILLLNPSPTHNPAYLRDLIEDINQKLLREHDKIISVRTQDLLVENENRGVSQIKTKGKKAKPLPQPTVFECSCLVGFRATGTEHIEYAHIFEKVQVGIWCYPPTLEEEIAKVLLPSDQHPSRRQSEPQDD